MLVSYAIRGTTENGQPIDGHAVIDSAPVPAAADGSGLKYNIVAVQITAEGQKVCGCDAAAGFLSFVKGTDDSLVATQGANWKLGAWDGGGGGAWFGTADGTRYAGPSDLFGTRAAYAVLAPRIKLRVGATGPGAVNPAGVLMLTMVPDSLADLATPAPGAPGKPVGPAPNA